MITDIFMKSIRKICGYQREKIMTELGWLEVTLFMMLLAWNINLWVDKAIQVNEGIRSIPFTSTYIWNASVFYSTFQMLWCMSSEPGCEFLLSCKLMIISQMSLHNFLPSLKYGVLVFLRRKRILTSCSHWMILRDGWLNIYWIDIIVYIYQGLCWEACLRNCISWIIFEAF